MKPSNATIECEPRIERGAGGSQRKCAGAGRATGSLPGAIIGGAHASVQLSAARPALERGENGEWRMENSDDACVAILNPRSSILSSPNGFTLTELLIVIALIVLLLAMAVPAFKFITGGRSIDGAQNIVSAMLGRARARAIETERDAGVAFYLDPVTGRSTMTIVVQRDGASVGAEDTFDNYKGWKLSGSGATVHYLVGQQVIAVVADGDPTQTWPAKDGTIPAKENRLIVQKFVCIKDHDATIDTRPPNGTYWASAQQKFIDFDIDAESEFLPVGVGVQLVNDTKGGKTTPAITDRYVRTGVIMFDGKGRFDSIPYGIRAASALGQKIGLTADLDTPTYPQLYTQLGVALYDLSEFKDKDFTDNDLFAPISKYGATASVTGEAAEESWLDSESLLLTVNRYNGTLVRGE